MEEVRSMRSQYTERRMIVEAPDASWIGARSRDVSPRSAREARTTPGRPAASTRDRGMDGQGVRAAPRRVAWFVVEKL
jgi:hypothetical protein